MGICPCGKDRDLTSIDRKQGSELGTASFSSETTAGLTVGPSSPHVNLRADEQIIRLVGPISSYYRVISQLKSQGGSRVVLSEYVGTHQRCIIQVVPKASYRHPKRVKTILFGQLRRLDHPNILKTYEMCQDDNYIYIVSEAYEGGELGDYLESEGFFSQSVAANVIAQILSIVMYCHNQGLVLGRLNLSCFVLKLVPQGGDLTVKFVETDTTDLEDDDSPRHSIFSAPDEELTDKSDVWSCGVILYYLLSGRNPFENYRAPGYSRMLKYKGFSFPPAIWSHVNPEATALLLAMLNTRPQERPSIQECHAHPWIKRFVKESSVPSKVMRASLFYLQYNEDCRSLQEAIMRFIITRVLGDNEVAKRAKVFSALDKDCDGLISRSELLAGFRKVMPEKEAERVTDRVMFKVDRDLSGMIDYSEFMLLAFNKNKVLSKRNLKIAFSTLDRDGSGKVSVQELKHFFRINSTPGSLTQWKHLLAGVDSSGHGEIDFEEFQKFMTKALASGLPRR